MRNGTSKVFELIDAGTLALLTRQYPRLKRLRSWEDRAQKKT